ncbi:DUF1707 domain-containing protein [Streptomyces sp. NPDC000410]|uniref:DUF1707 SHOCT-like domain-containing protein n=1 Tax=Streptomyces sp. NPDC000410 TaxID=3154254 RepID=UPI00331F7A46
MTSDLPEMRASDAERERIAERLREAVAEGRIDMGEFEERLDAAYRARTHGELEPLVRDLPAPDGAGAGAGTGLASVPADGVVPWSRRIGRQPATSKGGFAFWSGFARKGTWTIGRRFTGVVLQGGGEIDLRDANFEERDVVIRCFAVMGGIQVTVPPDVEVHVSGFGLMGGFDEREKAAPEIAPGAPRVTVTGFALMGGVGVDRKLRKADKRRLRLEKGGKALEKGNEND